MKKLISELSTINLLCYVLVSLARIFNWHVAVIYIVLVCAVVLLVANLANLFVFIRTKEGKTKKKLFKILHDFLFTVLLIVICYFSLR